MALTAAPVPRPPQPMRATFSSSVSAACTIRACEASVAAIEPAAMAVDEVCRNLRRLGRALALSAEAADCEAGWVMSEKLRRWVKQAGLRKPQGALEI